MYKLLILAILIAGLGLTTIAHAADRPDPWITTKVKMTLVANPEVHGMTINVDTVDGRVVLHGTVDGDAEKVRAERLAKGVDGVKEVRNLLAVVPPARQEVVEAADDTLHRTIAAAIAADPTLNDSRITVKSVNGGVVYLTGEAASMSDQLRAMEHAMSAKGVKQVASEMSGPEVVSDAEIWRQSEGPAGDSPAGSELIYYPAISSRGAKKSPGAYGVWLIAYGHRTYLRP